MRNLKEFWNRVFHSVKDCKFHRVEALSQKDVCYRGNGVWPFTKGYKDCKGVCDKFEEGEV